MSIRGVPLIWFACPSSNNKFAFKIKNGKCKGVILENGDVIESGNVISSAGIQNTLSKFLRDEIKLESYKENLNKYLETPKNNIRYKRAFDTKDFDISFVKDLSLEDGAATLTDFTAAIIAQGIKTASGMGHPNLNKWLVCGGGRKNKYLMDSVIKKGPEYLKTDDTVLNEKLDDLKTISLEPIEKY